MPITTTIDNDKKLTLHAVVGEASFEEGMATLRKFWEDQPTRNVMWDFRKAKLPYLTPKETEAITKYIKRHWEKRSGGKTALVVSRELEYTVSSLARPLAEMNDFSIQMKFFRN